MRIDDPQSILMTLLALAIAIPVHEFAHALSAVNAGDEGPRRDGRLSIMPQDHFDPAGAFFCVMSSIFGFGLGWGRPVLVNPGVLRNPRWDMCRIAAWGPASNLLLAIGFAIPLRMGWLPLDPTDGLTVLLSTFVSVNLSLMVFNLLPIGPLDGAKVAVAFLSDRHALEFERFQERWGWIALFALIFAGGPVLRYLVGVPVSHLFGLLVTGW